MGKKRGRKPKNGELPKLRNGELPRLRNGQFAKRPKQSENINDFLTNMKNSAVEKANKRNADSPVNKNSNENNNNRIESKINYLIL
jgi:hypothetical protein